jgi:hypothetical protein
MQVRVEIELGNDAMQTKAEIGEAVNRAMIWGGSPLDPATVGESGAITDWNGNTVGKWEVVES